MINIMKIPQIPSELFTNFNDITYYDEPHKYFLNKKQFISVTTIIHKYQEKFDSDYWSDFKANEYGITKEQVLYAWDFINKLGTMKGSIIHDYVENLLLNKIFDNYPTHKVIEEFGFDPIKSEYNITKKHVDNFYKDSKNKLIPIKTELVVYDKESMISGMLDILFYNVKAGEFQIWDNKTNKDLSLKSMNKLLGVCGLLDDSDLEIYSLQLGLYKKIIEKNTSIKLGKSYIVWFSHNNDNYKVIECNDRSIFVDAIMQERIDEIKNVD